jgi:hypothetical protein
MVTLSPFKEKTLVTIQAQGAVAEAVIPKSLEGHEAAWDFQFAALAAAVTKRDAAKFSFNGGQLDIKENNYKVALQGVEANKVLRVEKPAEPTCSIEVDSELWVTLESMTSKVKIGKSLAALPDITVHYLFTKKLAMAVAFDRFQMAAYALPNTFGKTFELTLPLAKAESLFKTPGVNLLAANEALVYIKAGTIAHSSSLPSVEDTTGVPTDSVVVRVKALRSAEFPKQVKLPTEELKKFLVNARAVSAANALLLVEVGDGSSRLTLSSDGNKVSAVVPSKSKKKFRFKLDIGYVQTIVSKAGDSIQLEIDDSALVFRTEELIYASVLSVDDDDDAKASKRKSKDEELDEED